MQALAYSIPAAVKQATLYRAARAGKLKMRTFILHSVLDDYLKTRPDWVPLAKRN